MPNDIKISAAPDVASFRTVDNLIKTLTNSVNNLNRSMENVARSVAKIQTGGSSQQGNASAIKTGPQANKSGIVGAILGTGDGSSVGRIVSETNRAFDDISRKISTFTSKATSDMGRLNSSIGGRGSEAGWASKAIYDIEERGFSRGGGVVGRNRPGFMPGGIDVAPSGAPVNPIVPSTNRGGAGRGAGAGGGGGMGGFSGMGIVGGAEALMSGNVSGFLGSTLGRAGIAGAAAYGAYRLIDAGTNFASNALGANLNYQIQYPLAQEQAVGSAMASFKQFGRDAMAGNIIGMSGMRAAIKSDAYQAIIDPARREKMIQVRLGELTASGAVKNYLQDTLDPIAIDVQNRVGKISKRGYSNAFGGSLSEAEVAGDADATAAIGRHEQLRKMAEADVNTQISSDIDRLKSEKIRQNTSLDEYYMNALTPSGALSRVKTLRSFGRSTAPIKFKDGSEAEAYEWIQAQALAQGRDFGDLSQQYHTVDVGIGRGFNKVLGGFRAVSAGEAGFGNIAQIAKLAGMITGSVSGSGTIVNNVQGMINGSSGLDVTVGRDLFQTIAQTALNSGMYGGSSYNQVSRMVGTYVNAGGMDVAAQHRNAYAYGIGSQLEQSYSSGSRSPFDRASSWQDALNGTGSFDAGTIRLQEMGATDPRLLASIAYGGAKVPRWAEGLIDQGSARRYMESARRRPFATVVDELWSGRPKQAGILKTIREGGGDPNSFFESRLSGLKAGSKEWWKAEWEAAEDASGILGGNKEANTAMLSEAFLRTKTLDAPTGPGAHAPGAKDYEDIVLKHASSYQKEVAKAAKAKGGPLADKEKDEIAQKYSLKDHLEAEILLKGIKGDIPALSDAFVKAASDLATAIKNKATGKPQGAGAPT